MTSMSYLSLIQILNVLHSGQEKKTVAENLLQAKLLARQLLERGLEPLDSDARILLLLLEEKAPFSSEFRLNRKELQKKMGWDSLRFSRSLSQLVDKKFLRKHQKKQSCFYELLCDSAKKRREDYVMRPQGALKKATFS